jgi:hypothetical protein
VRAGPLSRKLCITGHTPADPLEICYFQNSSVCSRRRTAAPGASAVGYSSQSTAIFRGEDSGFFKINTGMRAPLSIEHPIELRRRLPKAPDAIAEHLLCTAQHYRCRL